MPSPSLIPNLRRCLGKVRPTVGHGLELIHEHGTLTLRGHARRDLDVVLRVRYRRSFDLYHLRTERLQQLYFLACLPSVINQHMCVSYGGTSNEVS